MSSFRARHLRGSHFLLLPTHYDNEGQPISIIEAMAYGCVVVSSPYRSIPDLVLDGVTGFLVDHRDSIAIANAVQSAAQDPDRYFAMSSKAVERFLTEFTEERHIERLLEVLRE